MKFVILKERLSVHEKEISCYKNKISYFENVTMTYYRNKIISKIIEMTAFYSILNKNKFNYKNRRIY